VIDLEGRHVAPVSVVVCARDREAMIARCLGSILAAEPDEVIVVDDGSLDRTADVAALAGARVIRLPRLGLAVARQAGVRAATNDTVVFVDSDVVVDPGAIRALRVEADAGDYDAVQSRIRSLDARGTYWQRSEAWRREVQELPGSANVLTFQATLVRRELLLRVGFDPVFSGAGEDHDFFYRARLAGARLAHSATAIAYHEDRRTLGAFVRQRLWHGRGMARLLIRYGRTETRAAPAAEATALEPIRLPFMAVSWLALTGGVVLEALDIARRPRLRAELRASPGPR
jgi:glycosyltransferase involved in cell wall biosynthesis